jgi:hypothetical protein
MFDFLSLCREISELLHSVANIFIHFNIVALNNKQSYVSFVPFQTAQIARYIK